MYAAASRSPLRVRHAGDRDNAHALPIASRTPARSGAWPLSLVRPCPASRARCRDDCRKMVSPIATGVTALSHRHSSGSPAALCRGSRLRTCFEHAAVHCGASCRRQRRSAKAFCSATSMVRYRAAASPPVAREHRLGWPFRLSVDSRVDRRSPPCLRGPTADGRAFLLRRRRHLGPQVLRRSCVEARILRDRDRLSATGGSAGAPHPAKQVVARRRVVDIVAAVAVVDGVLDLAAADLQRRRSSGPGTGEAARVKRAGPREPWRKIRPGAERRSIVPPGSRTHGRSGIARRDPLRSTGSPPVRTGSCAGV